MYVVIARADKSTNYPDPHELPGFSPLPGLVQNYREEKNTTARLLRICRLCMCFSAPSGPWLNTQKAATLLT